MFKGNKESKARFEMIYNAALECKDDSSLVSMVYDMVDILVACDEAYITEMAPGAMGIHPGNRMGKRMLAQTMQRKGAKIKKAGFTFKLCPPEKAVGFENDPDKNDCVNHTMWVTESDELFGTYQGGAIRAGSCGCSHLNQWLHAVACKAKSLNEDLCDKGSDRFSPHIVCGSNEQLSTALVKGLKWTIIKFTVLHEYKLLAQLITRGLNVEHHVGEGDRSMCGNRICLFCFLFLFVVYIYICICISICICIYPSAPSGPTQPLGIPHGAT